MSEGADDKEKHKLPPEAFTPGFCSAVCTDEKSFRKEIEKPMLKTSDLYTVCNLPPKFEHPHWFNGYGSQQEKQHPFYRTTSGDYGWYPPGYHSVSMIYRPKGQAFSSSLLMFGMYRDYSLNVNKDKSSYN